MTIETYIKKPPVMNNITGRDYVCFAESNVAINNTELMGASYFGFGTYINSGLVRSYCQIGRYCSIGRNVSIGDLAQ